MIHMFVTTATASFQTRSQLEIELAERVTGAIPGAEMRSGLASEANAARARRYYEWMLAARIDCEIEELIAASPL